MWRGLLKDFGKKYFDDRYSGRIEEVKRGGRKEGMQEDKMAQEDDDGTNG